MSYSPSFGSLPGGLANPNVGSVGGSMATEKVVSTLYDYDPYAIYRAVADRHTAYPMFRQMLRMQNATRAVSAPTTGHYERDWRFNLVTFASIDATTAAGEDAVYTLDASSMYDLSVNVSGSARQASAVRVGDIIESYTGARILVTAKTTSSTPHTITVKPLSASVDVDAEFSATGTYAIFGNMHAEGSTIPEGLLPRISKYTNVFQIVKEGAGTTGTELTNQTWAQIVPGKDGSIFMAIEGDTMMRYERAMCYTLLFGTTANNLTAAATTEVPFDVAIKGTEGLVPFVSVNGHTDNYTSGSYSIDDFDAMAVIFEQERIGTRQIVTYDGYTIFQETENALQTLLNANLTVELLKTLGGDGKVPSDSLQPYESNDFSFYIGFRAVRKSGYDFFFRMLHEFNDYTGAGAPNYEYPSYRIATPLGFAVERASGNEVPYVSYEYKGLNGYNRHDLVDYTAGIGVAGAPGMARVASTTYDVARMGIVSEIAGHFACPNKCILQTPA